ncbi:hypothetical protein PKOR_11820 [Pontibacter korlensis]|uniref:Uncharacterized protein n=1 Tax=Pontibacter korlensis TaxID=400092 RepID=A0A0E3UWU7_9BACT|nr:hypothetical protein PKOR_11820 [Pontibacter korlensis]
MTWDKEEKYAGALVCKQKERYTTVLKRNLLRYIFSPIPEDWLQDIFSVLLTRYKPLFLLPKNRNKVRE